MFSDPHFNDFGILKYERTEFKTIKEHNERIIKNINSKVLPTDTIICLGDLGYNWKSEIQKIKCEYKVLILGNHDHDSTSSYYDVFNMVFNGPVFLNQFIVLSHEPWPGCGEYCFNIHGHLHNSELDLPGYFCVSAKNVNYMPLMVERIYKKNDKLKRNHEHFLEEWYADNYKYLTMNTNLPLKDFKLIKTFKDIQPIISNFNKKYKTNYLLRDVDWFKYRGLEDQISLEEFIETNLLAGGINNEDNKT